MRLPRIFVVAAAFCLPVALTAEVSFNRDIRPILSDKCFRCHGPDANAREADLRLDLEGWAKQDLGGYAAIVPGDPDKSELIWRITEEFEEEVMPPPEVHKPVTAREVELLTQWIKDGASYDVHWSFKPVEKPEIPEVGNAAWCRNEIDYFILSKLDEVGL
ncbi:MAG: hypothetical protein KJT03_20440, partial [Verrucomicrobiae bacterium]|nr:hypothetical protein [Verrucomicrobiae bacterium]